MEAEWLNDINYFQRVKQILNNFCAISLKTYAKKTKTLKIYSEITYFYQLSFFF